MDELKPCPFCGGNLIPQNLGGWEINCPCGASLVLHSSDKNALVAAWNTRAASEQQPQIGYALAMRVLQSDLYRRLDDVERGECEALIAREQRSAASAQQIQINAGVIERMIEAHDSYQSAADRGYGQREEGMRLALIAGGFVHPEAKIVDASEQADPSEQFCDSHCTWRDHAPGCVRASLIKPNPDEVICPACVHQFRAIPETVQALMIGAGFEPPFTDPPVRAEPSDEPFGCVTKDTRGTQRFYPAGQLPYLDTAVECVAVYTRPAKPLTEEIILAIFAKHGMAALPHRVDAARDIVRAQVIGGEHD